MNELPEHSRSLAHVVLSMGAGEARTFDRSGVCLRELLKHRQGLCADLAKPSGPSYGRSYAKGDRATGLSVYRY